MPFVEWSAAGTAYPGEQRSGDRHIVVRQGSHTKVAVIDGIGHGPLAAEAADAAIEVIEEHGDDNVERLFSRCHERLSDTRGAAMTLLCFDSDSNLLTWLGAGNVQATMIRDQGTRDPQYIELLVRSGVVGSNLPPLSALQTELQAGDVLALTTDGISGGFLETIRPRENLQRQADRILARYRLPTDDALVLLTRVDGNAAD